MRPPQKYACIVRESPACFASCRAIRIRKFGKFLLVESAIWGIGVCNSAQVTEIESTFPLQGIRNPVPGIRNPQRRIQNPRPCSLSHLGRHVYFSSQISINSFCHTSETAVVIHLLPDAPIISCTSPVSFVKMVGDMDENGRLPGSGKLTSEG